MSTAESDLRVHAGASDAEQPRAAECAAACERARVAGRLVVAYELVARRAGCDEVIRFRNPLFLKVEADCARDTQAWNGDWLESLWRVRFARPLERLGGADSVFVRGTAVSRDLRTRAAAIVMAQSEPRTA
ncbi:hypothetical protein [Paraburkholderia youngii]|uniref:hypothetical protein n=1 Tax=Paraburkholderia youngii TaxID=2782701 RepID=UPI003D1C13C6